MREGASSFEGCRDRGLEEVEPARAGCIVPDTFLKGNEVLLLAGVGGVLPSAAITGLPACWVESRDGTRDPVLGTRLIA
jgi:hypothetical protein